MTGDYTTQLFLKTLPLIGERERLSSCSEGQSVRMQGSRKILIDTVSDGHEFPRTEMKVHSMLTVSQRSGGVQLALRHILPAKQLK
jgi:hypothetical protein